MSLLLLAATLSLLDTHKKTKLPQENPIPEFGLTHEALSFFLNKPGENKSYGIGDHHHHHQCYAFGERCASIYLSIYLCSEGK
jgi:hypothetical protein